MRTPRPRREMRNPDIYDRYAREEAAGYLAQLLASRCHLAGLKFGPLAELEQAIGAIRHDVPVVDAIARLLTELSHEKCACDLTPDEDGEVEHRTGCRRQWAQAIIDTLRK